MARRRGRANPIREQELEDVLEEVLNESDLDQDDPFADDDIADDDFNICENQESSTSCSSDENLDPPSFQNHGRGRSRSRRGTRSRALRGGRGSRSRARSALRPVVQLNQEIAVDNVDVLADETWEDCNFEPAIVPLMEPSYLPIDRSNFNKVDYFEQYIDVSVIENIVEKSNWSYFARYTQSLNLTFEECMTYFAISMIMSCINYPSLRMYWSKEFRVPIIANNLPRNRFMLLRNAIKLVLDEDISSEERKADKLWKVRPLINAVLKGCQKQEKPKDLSIDEMIIPFQGTCGVKQYCPGKPNPVGLKAFVLATPKGLVCDFHIYQGSTTYPDLEDSQFGLGEKAILSLTKDLIPGHIIYCDRYFTSKKLLIALQDKGLMCTGTIMKNRVPRSAREVLPEDKAMKKKSRGSWQIAVNKAKKLVLTKWVDSKPVTFLSNIHADKTVDNCERWSKKEKKYVSVPRPEVVKLYNKNMGGVDLADRMLSVCPFRYRTKKWTQRVISHFMDLAISNSWILYREDELNKGERLKTIQQLRAFKLDIAKTILYANIDKEEENSLSQGSQQEEQNGDLQQRSQFRQRNAPVPLPSDKQRFEGAVHLPEVSDIQKICRRAGCKKKSKVKCSSCKMHLCLTYERNCFKHFHDAKVK